VVIDLNQSQYWLKFDDICKMTDDAFHKPLATYISSLPQQRAPVLKKSRVISIYHMINHVQWIWNIFDIRMQFSYLKRNSGTSLAESLHSKLRKLSSKQGTLIHHKLLDCVQTIVLQHNIQQLYTIRTTYLLQRRQDPNRYPVDDRKELLCSKLQELFSDMNPESNWLPVEGHSGSKIWEGWAASPNRTMEEMEEEGYRAYRKSSRYGDLHCIDIVDMLSEYNLYEIEYQRLHKEKAVQDVKRLGFWFRTRVFNNKRSEYECERLFRKVGSYMKHHQFMQKLKILPHATKKERDKYRDEIAKSAPSILWTSINMNHNDAPIISIEEAFYIFKKVIEYVDMGTTNEKRIERYCDFAIHLNKFTQQQLQECSKIYKQNIQQQQQQQQQQKSGSNDNDNNNNYSHDSQCLTASNEDDNNNNDDDDEIDNDIDEDDDDEQQQHDNINW
jgi:hypothetical protein